MIRRGFRLVLRLGLFLGQAALIVFVTLVLAGAFAARQRPDLEIWHTVELASEFRAGDRIATLEEYLQNEETLYAELERLVFSPPGEGSADELNRYSSGSRSFPGRAGVDWNRSEVLEPPVVRGGVLLLHGMTDAPYSLRHLAEFFHRQGYFVVNLRLPGHGTVPAELARVDWRDWDAAVRLGARAVAARLGAGLPFQVVGYSNGGALAMKYTLDSLEDPALRTPEQLIMISPMIGVSGLAGFGKIYYWLSKLDYFEQAGWLEIYPEYDPHKYNSFPMNAPRQSAALTRLLDRQLLRLSASGALDGMPPVLTFQSLVDATVVTSDIVDRLYERLPGNGSELVVFDVNRGGVLEHFVRPQHNALMDQLRASGPKDYSLTLVSNAGPATNGVAAYLRAAGSGRFEVHGLDLRWPDEAYSLSHVAIPFPPDDAIYGYLAESANDAAYPRLGRAQMVGESGALDLPPVLFTRLRSNPFYDYVEERIGHRIAAVNPAD
jgi:alpha-beta hydrolase superfamily lysophospholipase